MERCKKCGADKFDGVLSCGSIYYESDNWTHESRQCLRRQLAAANERAEKLRDALEDAKAHLEFCGYGDSYEREGAMQDGLPEKIDKALEVTDAAND